MKKKSMNRLQVFIFLCFLFMTLSSQGQSFAQFQDSALIDHVYEHAGFIGGGAAFFDYDNDGDDDLYITAGDDRDHFYRNNGDGTFTNITLDAGFVVTKIYYTTGVTVGDIDNDGFKDLFVTTWFADFEPLGKNLLYRNNGDGTFSEIWTQQSAKDKVFSVGATFLDFDLDGWLDLYVVNYIDEGNFIYDNEGNIIGFDHSCYKNTFYRNLGNGEFVEVASATGLSDSGCSLASAASDFDLDGDPDLFVANDFGSFILPNKLFQNDHVTHKFDEVASQFNADYAMYGMGIAAGDIDMDLDLDYYITNFGSNILLENHNTHFTDKAVEYGIDDTWISGDSLLAVSWGAAFFDADNDMDLDLFVADGYIPSPEFLPSFIYMKDKLFINNGDLTFSDMGDSLGIDNKYTSRGMTYSDYDNDGDVDILTVVQQVPVNATEPRTVLYRNESGNGKNWLQVTLEGVHVNRDAYGSKVFVHAGDKVLLRELSGGASHCSHYSSRLHFGLDELEIVDSLEIEWTGGTNRQTLYDLDVNQVIHIVEDTSDMVVTTARENSLLADRLTVFPNPARAFTNVYLPQSFETDTAQLSLYNPNGGVMSTVDIDSLKNPYRWELGGVESGVYWIVLETAEGKFYDKLVIY